MSERGRLAGRGAVVTGASSGIGQAVAIAFAREGASLLLTYRRNASGANEVARQIRASGGDALPLEAGSSREADVARLGEEALARPPRVGVWVNSAGADILSGGGAALDGVKKLDQALDVDLRGTVLCSWQAARRMRA